MGGSGEVSAPGKGVFEALGAPGVGGVRAPVAGGGGGGGIIGGWASLTMSSPDESDSLSDSENWWSLDGARIGCANFDSFAGN